MSTIKLIPGRMAQLRQTLKTEEAHLQQTAEQVARIAASLDMDLKAREGIDSGLTKLRSSLRKQAVSLTTMANLADTAEAELAGVDADLADKAGELMYTLRQMLQYAGTGNVSSAVKPVLNLTSQMTLPALSGMAALLGGLGDPVGSLGGLAGLPWDSLTTGVPLGDLVSHTGIERIFYSKGTDLSEGQVLGIIAGGMTTLSGAAVLVNVLDKGVSSAAAVKKTSLSSNSKLKRKSLLDKVGDFGSSLAKGASDVWDSAKDLASDAWDGAKDLASDTWDGAKDLASDTWDFMRDIVESKPMEYVWEMGGAVLGGTTDVFSFCGNVLTGAWAGAAADTYGLINNVFDFSQDLSALGVYGLGTGMEALGIGGDDVMARATAMADELSDRDGLVGELDAAGFDAAADFVEGVDATVNIYKFTDGIKNLKESPLFNWKDVKSKDILKGLLETSGWKIPDSVSATADMGKKIEYFDDLFSNADLAYKYVNGFLSGEAINAILENTQLGKIIGGPAKIIEPLTDEVS